MLDQIYAYEQKQYLNNDLFFEFQQLIQHLHNLNKHNFDK